MVAIHFGKSEQVDLSVCGRYKRWSVSGEVCSCYVVSKDGWYMVGMWSVSGWYVVGKGVRYPLWLLVKISPDSRPYTHMINNTLPALRDFFGQAYLLISLPL